MGQERKGSTGLGGATIPNYKSSRYTSINNILQKGVDTNNVYIIYVCIRIDI